LTSAHGLEGNTPIGEAHSSVPDLPDLQAQGSIVWGPESVEPMAEVCPHQARKVVLDEGACVRPDPWPSPSVVIVDPDARSGSASQLKGEQNIHSPSGGRELHAAPSAPPNYSSSFSPFPSDAIARENPPGEGAASEWSPTDICPKTLETAEPRITKTYRKQGEGHQYGVTHLCSLKILDPLGLLVTWGELNPWALMRTDEGECSRLRTPHLH